MQIATRWGGWCASRLGAAAAISALYTRHDGAKSVPANESWRELTYRTYVAGLECRSTPEQEARARIENEEALADCMDSWEGAFAVHTYPPEPGSGGARMILVEADSPLDECMRIRNRDAPFCESSWARPPADAQWNVPLHLGDARPHVAQPR